MPFVRAFEEGLESLGFKNGSTVTFETLWAEEKRDRLPELAAEAAQRNVDVIVSTGDSATARIAMAATRTIPIVFATIGDPVRDGLVASLAKPGGNVTGVAYFTAALYPKRLDLILQVVPKAGKVAFLTNPAGTLPSGEVDELRRIAALKRIDLVVLEATDEKQVAAAIASLEGPPATPLMVHASQFLNRYRAQIASLTRQHRVPAIYANRVSVIPAA